ncbi:P-loop containing nucleoside triphosphate hydrolase protein [Rhypophila decipiens]
MDTLLALAGTTSLFGSGNMSSTSIDEQLEENVPGFGLVYRFFKTWLKIDLSTLITLTALWGAASSGFQGVRTASSKIYWWIVRFLTASISISGNDRLNKEIINYLATTVLTRSGTRILTAHSESKNHNYYYRRAIERNDYKNEKRVPVQYLPTFGTTWFIHERNLFMVRRIFSYSNRYNSTSEGQTPDEYAGAPEGDEPLVVMCLGRSVQPIKRFLEMVREFDEKQREAYVTIRASKRDSYDPEWDTTILRPPRSMDTVHLDEKIKQELLDDIAHYLDHNTRQFYHSRGIPYRRGYLLHGPPGTGKSSLSQALAGKFRLDLYMLHLPTVRGDSELDKLFTTLPPRCIVLLEDIDAVGIKRHAPEDEDSSIPGDESLPDGELAENLKLETQYRECNCTLSGLLNILDGVSSQEGRIVVMTSNYVSKLDKALIRPGRVDKMIYMGCISKQSAELMFLRMYAADLEGPEPADENEIMSNQELKELASEFSSQIPDDVFTPAQLQGCLLSFHDSPKRAVAGIADWVAAELVIIEAEREKERKFVEKRRKQIQEARELEKLNEERQARRKASSDSEAEIKKLKKLIDKRKRKRKVKKEKTKTKSEKQEDAKPVQSGDEDKTQPGEETVTATSTKSPKPVNNLETESDEKTKELADEENKA